MMTVPWLSELPARGNPLRMAIVGFAVCFALWHIATNIWLNEPGKWQNAIHFAGFAFLAAVTISPFGRNSPRLGRSRSMSPTACDCRRRALGGLCGKRRL
jgi:TRAP-type uncharacterized transport system fused permease subunit